MGKSKKGGKSIIIKPRGNKTETNDIKRDPAKTLLGAFNGTMTLYTLQDKIKR